MFSRLTYICLCAFLVSHLLTKYESTFKAQNIHIHKYTYTSPNVGLRLGEAMAVSVFCLSQTLLLSYTSHLLFSRYLSVDANEDALNIAAIVIAVIAVVIIAGLVVVIIFLLKKIRGPKDRLNSKCSDPRGKFAGIE